MTITYQNCGSWGKTRRGIWQFLLSEQITNAGLTRNIAKEESIGRQLPLEIGRDSCSHSSFVIVKLLCRNKFICNSKVNFYILKNAATMTQWTFAQQKQFIKSQARLMSRAVTIGLEYLSKACPSCTLCSTQIQGCPLSSWRFTWKIFLLYLPFYLSIHADNHSSVPTLGPLVSFNISKGWQELMRWNPDQS